MAKFCYFSFFLIISKILLINSNSIFDYSYNKGDPLEILAGSLSSKKNIIPYGYTKLNICQSEKYKKAEDTLGEILTGEILYTTGYKVNINEDKLCQVLCNNTFSEKQVDLMRTLIKRNYFTNWIVDKLPAGKLYYHRSKKEMILDYLNGIPLGFMKDDIYYIFNHLQFHILLNKLDNDSYNVVGFNILPLSIKHNNDSPICAQNETDLMQNFDHPNQPLDSGNILFTYDVLFEYSDITLASRWDHYGTSKESIHWAGIYISEILIFCISAFMIIILCKIINKDISTYNYRISQFEDIDEYDWKQISGDVFRPPAVNPLLLSSILGTGTKLYLMVAVILLFGFFGYINPEQRKNILNICIIFFCFMGFPGGYMAASFYKLWGGKNWVKVSLLTSMLFPGMIIFGYIIINIVLTYEQSNAAVQFRDILSLFVLWIFCTLPLILIGSFLGAKSKRFYLPCEINRIPNEIPNKPWYLHYKYITFIAGFVGFATIFIELRYVMGALWNHEIYLLAAYFWISFYLFIIVVGEISVLFVFFNLFRGDYNWWWKSFIIGSSPVIYFILYSVYYFFYMRISRLSAMVVYFGIMGLLCAIVFFVCGTISLFFNFVFLKFIYSKLRRI
jgi:transmembrane 9 superfamily protein 2/4